MAVGAPLGRGEHGRDRADCQRLFRSCCCRGVAGAKAVEAWIAPRKAEVERIRMSVHEIANSGLTLSKLSVGASLLGDLVKN
jgi:glutamate dehydrogenase